VLQRMLLLLLLLLFVCLFVCLFVVVVVVVVVVVLAAYLIDCVQYRYRHYKAGSFFAHLRGSTNIGAASGASLTASSGLSIIKCVVV
jgi:hypothetical protein